MKVMKAITFLILLLTITSNLLADNFNGRAVLKQGYDALSKRYVYNQERDGLLRTLVKHSPYCVLKTVYGARKALLATTGEIVVIWWSDDVGGVYFTRPLALINTVCYNNVNLSKAKTNAEIYTMLDQAATSPDTYDMDNGQERPPHAFGSPEEIRNWLKQSGEIPTCDGCHLVIEAQKRKYQKRIE